MREQRVDTTDVGGIVDYVLLSVILTGDCVIGPHRYHTHRIPRISNLPAQNGEVNEVCKAENADHTDSRPEQYLP